MSRTLLQLADVELALKDLEGWAMADDEKAIAKVYRFSTFARAFGFMSECAIHAEKIDHHPDWRNVYRTVHVTLSTHSAGGITGLDIDLARFMQTAAARH